MSRQWRSLAELENSGREHEANEALSEKKGPVLRGTPRVSPASEQRLSRQAG